MKKPSPLCNQSIVLALVVLALMPAYPQTILAQDGQPQPKKLPVDPRERAKLRTRMMVETINQRAHELGLVSVTDDPQVAEFIRKRMSAQLSEDFERLYSINVEKIATQSSAASLDYKTLADVTGDLKSRATRIKYNVLLLQVADKGEKIRYDPNPDQLSSMLPELSRLIDSFLDSPVFRVTSADDAALRLKAKRDLDGIIKLSDAINKIAKRSTRTAASR
ncbi:MAG: hypothetical protein WAU45_15815 [Blastocatellia bacterium]